MYLHNILKTVLIPPKNTPDQVCKYLKYKGLDFCYDDYLINTGN
jgi:hypothetical protein